MTVTRATARAAPASAGRPRLARVTRRLAAPGAADVRAEPVAATLRKLRARGLARCSVTVAVAIRDSRGQTRSVKSSVRIRIR